MDFFKRVGRQVEEFKQTAKQAADENADYQCQACDARFHTDHEQCPACGAQQVVETTGEE